MEETYYKKILVTSGEAPEDGIYDFTSHGQAEYINGGWRRFHPLHGQWVNVYPEWYMKPVPSPKQEAIEFAEWKDENYYIWIRGSESYLYYLKTDGAFDRVYYTLSELYDKFKKQYEL